MLKLIYHCTFVAILFSTPLVKSQEYYLYKDQFGNLVYSDKPPEKLDFDKKTANKLQVTQWNKVNKPKFKAAKKHKTKTKKSSKANASSSSTNCKSLTQKITSLERKLGNRLEASEFDKAKTQLSEARWQFRKKC